MKVEDLDAAELLRREQERSSQLETYAADLRRTYSELRRHLQRVTVLHEVNTRIAAALDPDEVLDGVLESLNELLSYEAAGVYLSDVYEALATDEQVMLSAARPRLRAGRSCNGGPSRAVEGSLADDDSAIVQAMRDRKTIAWTTPSDNVQLVVPLRAGGRSLGALELTLAEAPREWDIKIVELLAAAAAVALHNAHLYQETQRLATIDALTGLSNYRQFHDLLVLEVQRARRMDYPVGLILMDLDHFKQVNDHHGHPTGDVALQMVAQQLRTRLRRTDVVGRVGGEEFAAILPGDSLTEVAIVAEKLRRAIEELPPLRGGMTASPTRVTLSVGGTSLSPDVVDAELLFSCADRALYQAKHSGRNRVRLWTDAGPSSQPPQESSPRERRSA